MAKISKQKLQQFVWILIVIVHMFLLLHITFFPYPELFVYPYLTKIGLLPYKQIFDQHFPGLMFFPINFATLGINTPDKFRLVQLILVIVTHFGLKKISEDILKKNYSYILIASLYLVWQCYFEGGTLWIESLLVPLLTWNCYFTLKSVTDNKDINYLLSGFTLGLALITKQIVVPLALFLGIYLLIKQRSTKLVVWGLAAVIPILLLCLFVTTQHIWPEFIYWAGTFNFTAYHEMGRKYATTKEVLSTSFIALPALISIFLLSYKKIKADVILLTIFFLTGFLYAYARFDYIHLQPVIPFALLLTWKGIESSKFRVFLGIGFLIFSLLYGTRFFIRNWDTSVKFFGQEDYRVFETVRKYSQPGDAIFAFATYPYIYPMTQTRPSGNVFVFQFPWFMKIAEKNILDGLITDPPVVVVRDETAITDIYNLVSYMPEIENYINRYYKRVDQLGTTEILIRK